MLTLLKLVTANARHVVRIMDTAKIHPTPPPSMRTDGTEATDRFSLPPVTRFQLLFPSLIEKLFAPFDDAIVALCQRRTTGIVLFFSTTFTFFTSIEVSLIAPPTLYALGYDRAAGLCASVLLVLGVLSQVPKKFIFRPRPWMVSRALPIRRDKTSSFPSRAVVCAVVFSWLIFTSAKLEGILSNPIPAPQIWLAIFCVAALTAFARINVGAHYPSDTVLGFVLGCVVVRIGSKFEDLWRLTCDLDASYVPFGDVAATARWWHMLNLFTARPFLILTLLSYAMTLVSIQGFWVKCSYVYGLLLSSAAFRATYFCRPRPSIPGSRRVLAQVLNHGSLRGHIHAGTPFTLLLIFGMITRGKKGSFRIISFTVIYFGALIAMLTWRLQSDLFAAGGRR